MDPFRSLAYRLVALLMAGPVFYIWYKVGPGNPGVAVAVASWTWVLDPAIIEPVKRFMPAHWFRVPEGEDELHRLLGVSIFARLLELSGWNSVVVRPLLKTAGYKPGTKGSLRIRADSARIGGGAHAICFAIQLVVAAAALFSGHARTALWIPLPGVVLHLYPTLLQRSILLRLQPLLVRSAVRA
jgi:hypothetical protein